MFHVKQEPVFKKVVLKKLLGDVGCSGLTVDSVVLILQSLVSQLGELVLLSTKNPEAPLTYTAEEDSKTPRLLLISQTVTMKTTFLGLKKKTLDTKKKA